MDIQAKQGGIKVSENKKKFTIEVEMEERWVPYFLSMLDAMETLGDQGSSRYVALFADGDGDFRPKFTTDEDFETKKPEEDDNAILYDAG